MTHPAPAQGNVTWTVGDTNDMLVQVTDPVTLLPYPLGAGSKVWLAAKRRLADADGAAVVYLTSDPGGGIIITNPTATLPTDPGAGQAIISLPLDALAAVAAEAPLWLQYAVQAQSGDKVWEVVRGVVYVRRGVVEAQA